MGKVSKEARHEIRALKNKYRELKVHCKNLEERLTKSDNELTDVAKKYADVTAYALNKELDVDRLAQKVERMEAEIARLKAKYEPEKIEDIERALKIYDRPTDGLYARDDELGF